MGCRSGQTSEGYPVKYLIYNWSRLNSDPQTCTTPNPGKYEYVILHGKKEVTGVIKLRILRWGDYLVLSGWPRCNQKGLYKGIRETGESVKETWKLKQRSERCTAKPKECGRPLDAARVKERSGFSSRTSRRDTVLLTPCSHPLETYFGTLPPLLQQIHEEGIHFFIV